jgi:hypothetical protein
MISQFSAIQAIAARRGDGLRPELLRLLEADRREAEASRQLIASDDLPEGVLRFPPSGLASTSHWTRKALRTTHDPA